MESFYRWNPDSMTRVFALPAQVVDKHIRLAGAKQLKVLLWLACGGEGRFDADACAADIGGSAADCADALQYWAECGLLQSAEGDGKAVAEAAAEAPDRPQAPAAPPKAAPAPRPRAVKPQFQEVLKRQKESEEFAYLLDTASARLGRPISHGDMETLLYLYDTAGLPIEVILMVLAYAVAAGKLNMRYVEKVALDWADQGIDTIAAAEQHLLRLERRDQAGARVQALLQPERPLTAAQKETAEKWLHEWRMADGLIQLAAKLCQAKIGKLNLAYVDKILESWHQDGVDTLEKARALVEKSRGGKAVQVENSSLNLDDYEKMVLDFVPVLKEG